MEKTEMVANLNKEKLVKLLAELEETKIQELRKKILKPVGRIISYGFDNTISSGSAAPIFCGHPNENSKLWLYSIITNHHVIRNALGYKEQWDGIREKTIEIEIFRKIFVEFFEYDSVFDVVSTNKYEITKIIAHSMKRDVAILGFETPEKIIDPVKLMSGKKALELGPFDPVYCAGCSISHDPIHTSGDITHLNEIIDGQPYHICSANAIWGNSGCPVYSGKTKEVIGMTTRVPEIKGNVVSWMNIFIPVTEIHKFIKAEKLNYLTDERYTYEQCMEERKKEKEKSEN